MTATRRSGHLFEGYGGLSMAADQFFGTEAAWHSEIEPAAVKLLEHHYPGRPNLGDITQVEWADVEPVWLLTGGFPCQDVSSAGKRAGMRPDSRSGLWTHMARAIAVLRPQMVLIENVRGLLSAEAASELEPCPWCVGDGSERPLRALGAVLGDLAVLGYDARWVGVRAADVGAPHGRFRVFIAAWPTVRDPYSIDRDRRGAAGLEGEAGPAAGPAANTSGGELQGRRVGGVVAGQEGPGEGEGPQRQRDRDPAGDGGAAAADPTYLGHERGGNPRGRGTGPEDRGRPVADPAGPTRRGPQLEGVGPSVGLAAEPGERAGATAWGDYEPAIRSWEHVLGRPAPAPTQLGTRGGQQLSARFVEWMMGLPEGWVTDVPGITRNQALKLLGNGVVPQQAELALDLLTDQLQGEGAA